MRARPGTIVPITSFRDPGERMSFLELAVDGVLLIPILLVTPPWLT